MPVTPTTAPVWVRGRGAAPPAGTPTTTAVAKDAAKRGQPTFVTAAAPPPPTGRSRRRNPPQLPTTHDFPLLRQPMCAGQRMHEFGAAYRMTLHPDTTDERILLDIPVRDFEWQFDYEPVEDIRIKRGDTVRFECWWDRTLQHMPEPRYIIWNEGTGDEMCVSGISVLLD